MQELSCPLCGSPMRLRTARVGRNAGEQFYGCTNFPVCQGTRLLDPEIPPDQPTARTRANNGLPELLFPRKLQARPRQQHLQVQFYECVAVSSDVLEAATTTETGNGEWRAFSQWRIDFPQATNEVVWSERHAQVVAVAEKILTRGRITLSSPKVEQLVSQYFPHPGGPGPLGMAPSNLLATFHQPVGDFWLDSPAEETFYQQVLPHVLGPGFSQWVVPQVELASLLPPAAGLHGRADFLITYPDTGPVVVEIDGDQHQGHITRDEERDAALREHGFPVIRIPASELLAVDEEKCRHLARLLGVPGGQNGHITTVADNQIKAIHATKICHQVQLVILQAIRAGFLVLNEAGSWHLSSDLHLVGLYTEIEALSLLTLAVTDLLDLLRHLGSLFGVNLDGRKPKCSLGVPSVGAMSVLHISYTGTAAATAQPTFRIKNLALPFHLANEVSSSSAAVLDRPEEQVVQYFLTYLFRKPRFWEGQFDAIVRALQGKDAMVLLPTGAGKSIAFQLASFLLPGRTVVIAPLISLIDDQIDNLAAYGIDRCTGITSQVSNPDHRARIQQLFAQGEYLFVYVAPERFQTVDFRQTLRALTVHTPVSLIVVDEAHCVSEWGHDFRTSYLNIGRISREYCKSGSSVPSLLALTGTASRSVLKDVQRELQIQDFDAIITPKSFDRAELRFHADLCRSDEKFARLKGYLGQKLPGMFRTAFATFYERRSKDTIAGLVFCPHVNGGFGVVQVADLVTRYLAVPNAYYSGQQPTQWHGGDYDQNRRKVSRRFKHDQIPLLVCTTAFGMGIDKPNIRYTVHYGLPRSIEAYYQEAGRAGRDRRVAHCLVLVSNDDPKRTRKLLDPNTPVDEIIAVVKGTPWDDGDDITRVLYFHGQAFQGINAEMSDVEEVLRCLGDCSQRATRARVFSSLNRSRAEKSLHRLLTLGVVEDYTIKFAADEFTVYLSGRREADLVERYGQYVGGYLGSRRQAEIEKAIRLLDRPYAQFVLGMVDLLLRFVYDVVERGRRRALQEMLLAVTDDPTDEAIRQRILRYLEATRYSDAIEGILGKVTNWIAETKDVFHAVRSPNEAAELRGQVSRYLESYPDHPGLLMLRALAELFTREPDREVTRQNFLAAVTSAEEKYSAAEEDLFDFLAWAIEQLAIRDLAFAEAVEADMLTLHPDPRFARALVRQLPPSLALRPAWFLLDQLADRCQPLQLATRRVAVWS